MARDFAKAFYAGKAWQQCRAGYIKTVDGLCERCSAAGVIKPGYIVHHKIPLTPKNINDPAVSLSWHTLEYLCKDCHEARHRQERPAPLQFDSAGQPIPPIGRR